MSNFVRAITIAIPLGIALWLILIVLAYGIFTAASSTSFQRTLRALEDDCNAGSMAACDKWEELMSFPAEAGYLHD